MNPHPDSQQAALSDQALAAFGLHSQPFSERPAGTDYFTDPVMQMQLNMLQHNIKFSDMLQVLKGDAGSGKTALVVQMLANAHNEFQIFVARGEESLSALQIVSGMLRIFQQPVPDDMDRCVNLLVEHLRIRLDKSLSSVLIIENAHLVAPATLNALFEQTDKINEILDGELRLLLVAEPDIEMLLPELDSKQLRDGKLFISSVRTLDRKRTAEYLTHRLQIAGFKGELPFSGRQLTDLYTNTDGIPQKIDVVAAQMLNQEAGQEPPKVVSDKLAELPLRPIAAAAVGAIAISLLMFLFAGSDRSETTPEIVAEVSEPTGNEKTVELEPTVIPSEDPEPTDSAEATITSPPQPAVVAAAEIQTLPPAEEPGATEEPVLSEDNQAATITLLSETIPNTVFAESHSVNPPLPAKTVEQTTVTPEAPKKPVGEPAPKAEEKKPVAAAKPAPLAASEKWLLQQKPERYVIQLLASYKIEDLRRYAKAHNIVGKTALFETTRESRRWHVLTYGLYASAETARDAISRLPAALQRNTPWIRSVKSIHLALKQRG